MNISEDTLRVLIRNVMSKHAPTMNMDRFENLCNALARDVYLHITSERKEDNEE